MSALDFSDIWRDGGMNAHGLEDRVFITPPLVSMSDSHVVSKIALGIITHAPLRLSPFMCIIDSGTSIGTTKVYYCVESIDTCC